MVDFNKLAGDLIQFYQSDGEIQAREIVVLEEIHNLDSDGFLAGCSSGSKTDKMQQLAAAVNSGGVVDTSDDLSLFFPDEQKTLRDLIGEKPFVASASIVMRRLQVVGSHQEADEVMKDWYDLTLNHPLPMDASFAEDVGKGLKHYLEFPTHGFTQVEAALDLLSFYDKKRYAEAFEMYVPQVTTPAQFREKVIQSTLPVILLDIQEVHPRGAFYLGRIYSGKVRVVAVDRAQFPSDSNVNIYDYFSTQLRRGMVEDYISGESTEEVISMEWVLIKDGQVVKRIVDRNVNDDFDPTSFDNNPIKTYFGIEIPDVVSMHCN